MEVENALISWGPVLLVPFYGREKGTRKAFSKYHNHWPPTLRPCKRHTEVSERMQSGVFQIQSR